MKPTVLTVAGTRPELLKLAPVIRHLSSPESGVATRTCFSGQHIEILNSILGDLDVTPDIDFRQPAQARSLSEHFSWLIDRLDRAMEELKPDGVIVQGDTNTVLAGALVGFQRKLPVFHVEAGLRTADPALPFPEEMNRRLVSRVAALHFAPTPRARHNLIREGVPAEQILVTGNTGIDTLRLYADRPSAEAEAILGGLTPGSRRLLVTLHRRENTDLVGEAADAVRQLVMTHPDVEVLWILHLNNIRKKVIESLDAHPRVHLLEPQSYRTFVHLMKGAYAILTDSGGVQEEAPTLGPPTLVMRNDTERPEAVEAGSSLVVGCDSRGIVTHGARLLDDPAFYAEMSQPRSPFGDGHAAERVVAALEAYYGVVTQAQAEGASGRR
jgi:UDP-N-acetylglucosamine 2-epimerase